MGASKALCAPSPPRTGPLLPRANPPYAPEGIGPGLARTPSLLSVLRRCSGRDRGRSGRAAAGAERGGAVPAGLSRAQLAAMAGWLARALLPGRALPAAPGPCPHRGCGEVAALRAMGFSQEQARRLLALQPRLGPEHREAAAAQLLLLGLSTEAALALLERSPALLRLPTERLRERAEELRRLGLDGGRLLRAVSRCPQLFHVPRKRLEAAVRLLRERCLFTAEQLREVLGTCPTVLLEEPRTLHHQFQVRTGTRLPARTGCGNRAVPDTPRPAPQYASCCCGDRSCGNRTVPWQGHLHLHSPCQR
uniref:Mitochondrial transcription termination factor 4 n=1 Tax=Corvus moneduloides TaxID=1196302 RepID=A0A8U7NCR7_CORMO